MRKVHLLLGSNLGDRLGYIKSARRSIMDKIGPVGSASRIYETSPWGFESEDHFLNQAITVKTRLEPQDLLWSLKRIEKDLGREIASDGYSSRVIDIDIIFYEDKVLDERELQIPHPRMQERLFTLVPLAEIDENMIHPVLKRSVAELLDTCSDQLQVSVYQISI